MGSGGFAGAVGYGVFEAGSAFRLGFAWGGALPGGLVSILGGPFATVGREVYFGGGAGRWAIILWDLGTLLISPNFLSRSATLKVLGYAMFISNNHASFHLWRNENFVKHQKAEKYYENHCSLKGGM